MASVVPSMWSLMPNDMNTGLKKWHQKGGVISTVMSTWPWIAERETGSGATADSAKRLTSHGVVVELRDEPPVWSAASERLERADG